MKFFIKLFVALTLAAGALIFYPGFFCGLPKGTFVDGIDVGGMPRAEAVAAARGRRVAELKQRELTIVAGDREYIFRYPEFSVKDNVGEVVRGIKRRGSYFTSATVYLNGEEEIVKSICASVEREKIEPYALFCGEGEPFEYFEGNDGTEADAEALSRDINASLNGNFEKVVLKTRTVRRETSLAEVKRRTALIGSFTTYFDGDNFARASNIRLAASKINGLVLGAGESFSFNAAVGQRTRANGYLPAKIISGGKFIDGVGGGVCQVSTTLYNAAVLSGMEIEKFSPHSLEVSYVAPSRDAMVSGTYCDLTFKNTRLTPIYIRVNVFSGGISCRIYGFDDGVKRSFVSRVVGTIEQPQDVIVFGGEEKVLSCGRAGTISEGYLVEEIDGVKREKLLRRDKYSPVAGVRQVVAPEANQPSSDKLSLNSASEQKPVNQPQKRPAA